MPGEQVPHREWASAAPQGTSSYALAGLAAYPVGVLREKMVQRQRRSAPHRESHGLATRTNAQAAKVNGDVATPPLSEQHSATTGGSECKLYGVFPLCLKLLPTRGTNLKGTPRPLAKHACSLR